MTDNEAVVKIPRELYTYYKIKIKNKVCQNCKFYNKRLGVCKGELLPVEEAILRNVAGMGTCDDVKKFVKEGKE